MKKYKSLRLSTAAKLNALNNELASLDVSGLPSLWRMSVTGNRMANLSALFSWRDAGEGRELEWELQAAG